MPNDSWVVPAIEVCFYSPSVNQVLRAVGWLVIIENEPQLASFQIYSKRPPVHRYNHCSKE